MQRRTRCAKAATEEFRAGRMPAAFSLQPRHMSLRQGRTNPPATPGGHGHTGIPRRWGISPAVACVLAAAVVKLTVTLPS